VKCVGEIASISQTIKSAPEFKTVATTFGAAG